MDSRGVTLPELVICVLLMGIAVQATLGPVRRQADAMALRGIREEVVALLHRARAEARVEGASRILFQEGADPLLLLPDDRPPLRASLTARGVSLEIEGARSSAELVYGPLGVAQFASATIVLRRGEAQTRLVISGYGRVRR